MCVTRFEVAKVFASRRFGFQRFAEAVGIIFYDRAGSVENILRRAVVTFEADDARRGEIAREAEEDGNVGAAPTVDGLIFVADNANVLFRAGEEAKKIVLDAVGVLIFVHVNVLEALLPALADIGRIF